MYSPLILGNGRDEEDAMTLIIEWGHVDPDTGEDVEYDLEVEIIDYSPGRIIRHLRPEDCLYEPGHIEIRAAIRIDIDEDVWPAMPAEERKRLADAAWRLLEKGVEA